jgi:hypothetical protein
MDIIRLLTEAGLDTETAKKAETAINKALPLEFVAKDQYNKKVAELDGSKAELKKYGDYDQIKTNLQKTEEEFTKFKTDTEAEKTTGTKRNALKSHLETAGANPKLIALLEREFDLEKIALEGDKIKDWDTLIKPVKENYGEIFGTIESKGAAVSTPPKSSNSEPDPFLDGFKS